MTRAGLTPARMWRAGKPPISPRRPAVTTATSAFPTTSAVGWRTAIPITPAMPGTGARSTCRVADRPWDILGPTLVEDGYELYWNGDLLGGSGRLGPDPRVVGTRPMRFALPPEASGKKGVLAIRAFMLPQSAASADGGGLHSAPILAPRPVSDELYRAQWERTIAGYIVDVVEPLAMTLLIGLLLWPQHRSVPGRFLRFAAIALALTAVRRLANAIVAWTDLVDLTTYAWLAEFLWMPTVAAWALAWESVVRASLAAHRCICSCNRNCRGRGVVGSRRGRDRRQPLGVDRPVRRPRRAHRPQWTNAGSRNRCLGTHHARILRQRTP